MNIEIILRGEKEEESIGITEKTYTPRVGDVLWILPVESDTAKRFGTRSFIVEEVCHHISLTLESVSNQKTGLANYDSIVLYVRKLKT